MTKEKRRQPSKGKLQLTTYINSTNTLQAIPYANKNGIVKILIIKFQLTSSWNRLWFDDFY